MLNRASDWVRRVRLGLLIVCGGTLIASVSLAQQTLSARERFAHGVALVQQGELEAAAAEFEEAYRISPNYLVLYNLGQAYLALGKPVEAQRAFESYLRSGGARISADRASEVRDFVMVAKKRVGWVALNVDPANADIEVDGQPIAKGPTAEPLALAVGTHSVMVTLAGYQPFLGHAEVVAEKSVALDVRLRAVPPPAVLPRVASGQLAIGCPVPDARVLLDQRAVSGTASGPLLVPVGVHEVSWDRDGYVPRSIRVEVTTEGVAGAICDLVPTSPLPSALAGLLTFSVSEPGAEIRVDGRRVSTTIWQPVGPHRVTVRRDGFEEWTQTVTVQPGFPFNANIKLRPTPEHALELRDAVHARRNWAYLTGGAGVSLVATGVALYATNSARYTSWERDRDAFSRDLQAQQWSPTLSQRAGDLQTRASSIQARDDLALGVGIVGGALLSYAIGSFLSAK
jgi:hypothetical protein